MEPGRLPTIYDHFGTSYIYNSDANNNNAAQGLTDKLAPHVLSPSLVILVDDDSSGSYFAGDTPFEYAYWHHKTQLGWGNRVFVDGHVAYQQATLVLKHSDSKWFQHGNGWSYIYNDR